MSPVGQAATLGLVTTADPLDQEKDQDETKVNFNAENKVWWAPDWDVAARRAGGGQPLHRGQYVGHATAAVLSSHQSRL